MPAIESLQIALRTDVDDHMSWLRLGEAYSKAGRYAAAFKALERAHELDPEDWVTSYLTGDVQRQMGAYVEAIDAFEAILVGRPDELGVLHSLGQTYLERGRFELAIGFLARAEMSFLAAIRITLTLVDTSSGFRRVAWKTIADSLYHLSNLSGFSDQEAVKQAATSVLPFVTEPGKDLVNVISQSLSIDDETDMGLFTLQVAFAAYECRLSLGAIDDAAKASAHYDIGTALSAFAKLTLDTAKREKAQQEAITQFKNALRLEPGNDAIWIALGNATFLSQPALCQHAYIRAIEIDGKVSIHLLASPLRRLIVHRMRRLGPILACSISTTKMSSWRMKHSTRHKRSIRIMPSPGLAKVSLRRQTVTIGKQVRCSST